MPNNLITEKQILTALKQLGIARGDTVMVHCALSSFGRVKNGAETVISALLKAVGQEGTIAMPSFGSPDPVFDPRTSKTNLGIVAQTFWKLSGVLRSRHPVASLAAFGPNAKALTQGHEDASTAHGTASPYHKLAVLNAKILLLGVDQDRNTFLHTVEEIAKAAYLKPKTATYRDSSGRSVTKTWPYFPGPHRDFIGLQSCLRDSGLISEICIGPCKAKLMPTGPLLEKLLTEMERNPNLFLSENPNLPDGLSQRADVLKTKLKSASFTLAADSRFSGQFIEEIINNLSACGIDNLVLSTVNDLYWPAIPGQKRKWYLAGLRSAGIKIAAIRIPTAAAFSQELFSESKCENLIVPSTIDFGSLSRLSSLHVFVENVGFSGNQMVDLLRSPALKQFKASAAFNPLNFTQVAEHPFLTTYTRTSIKSIISALYINDGFASGRTTRLEEGLAEIKELISILLCKSFPGLFILQGPGPAQFRQTAAKFFSMYDEVK